MLPIPIHSAFSHLILSLPEQLLNAGCLYCSVGSRERHSNTDNSRFV
jgi:hypothetical protein